jgi:hypothetical protein
LALRLDAGHAARDAHQGRLGIGHHTRIAGERAPDLQPPERAAEIPHRRRLLVGEDGEEMDRAEIPRQGRRELIDVRTDEGDEVRLALVVLRGCG